MALDAFIGKWVEEKKEGFEQLAQSIGECPLLSPSFHLVSVVVCVCVCVSVCVCVCVLSLIHI